MSRPHEDRQRHTLVDHRPGGSPATFDLGRWVVVGIARVKAERNDACVAAYETLLERARTSNVHAGPAVVLASENGRRVVVLAGVGGHDGFAHLAAAWDDHHRNAEHRVISESVAFALYEVVARTGRSDVDPASHDAYVFEHVARPVSSEMLRCYASWPACVGATIFSDDRSAATVVVSRFAHAADYREFRASRDAVSAFGSVSAGGDTAFAVRPQKTIAPVA